MPTVLLLQPLLRAGSDVVRIIALAVVVAAVVAAVLVVVVVIVVALKAPNEGGEAAALGDDACGRGRARRASGPTPVDTRKKNTKL